MLKLYPQRPTVYAGVLTFDPAALETLLHVANEWSLIKDEKAAMVVFLVATPDGKVRSVAWIPCKISLRFA